MHTASWLQPQLAVLLVGEKLVSMHNTRILIGQSLYITKEYKCLREGNILVNPPLLPKIQGLGGI
jgi:hypothetical protein